jgi:hypothetical protein
MPAAISQPGVSAEGRAKGALIASLLAADTFYLCHRICHPSFPDVWNLNALTPETSQCQEFHRLNFVGHFSRDPVCRLRRPEAARRLGVAVRSAARSWTNCYLGGAANPRVVKRAISGPSTLAQQPPARLDPLRALAGQLGNGFPERSTATARVRSPKPVPLVHARTAHTSVVEPVMVAIVLFSVNVTRPLLRIKKAGPMFRDAGCRTKA